VLNYAHRQLYNISPPLHGAIYYKGAWVLHMLRHVVGDENFFAGVKEYVADPELRYATGDTDDLRLAFENTSGMDLVWFFDQWIFSPGYPRYSNTWHATEAGDGFDLRLMINQGQVSDYPIFKMPMDIAVTNDIGEEMFVVWDSLPSQMFTLHTVGQPLSVQLDPANWIIKVEDTTTEVSEIPGVTGLDTWNHPNPFNPSTTIGFTLPDYGRAQLRIYDTSGRQVRQLFDAVTEAGDYEVVWDGRDTRGRSLPSGVYFHRLDTDAGSIKGQMVLLK
jgi:aminopeptidase N